VPLPYRYLIKILYSLMEKRYFASISINELEFKIINFSGGLLDRLRFVCSCTIGQK